MSATSHPVLTTQYKTGQSPLMALADVDPFRLTRASRALPQSFFTQEVLDLAPALLGCLLVHQTPAGPIGGLIVEAEAYRQHDDPGCHAYRGITPRTRPLFLDGGHSYVYLIYGMYYCLNIVAGESGTGSCVLIRALEPVEGLEQMILNRGTAKVRDLTRGPGRLTMALGIDLARNSQTIFRKQDALRILAPPPNVREAIRIERSLRINVTAVPSNTYDWRFTVAGNPFVS